MLKAETAPEPQVHDPDPCHAVLIRALPKGGYVVFAAQNETRLGDTALAALSDKEDLMWWLDGFIEGMTVLHPLELPEFEDGDDVAPNLGAIPSEALAAELKHRAEQYVLMNPQEETAEALLEQIHSDEWPRWRKPNPERTGKLDPDERAGLEKLRAKLDLNPDSPKG